ncbi:MAG: hypothetical protein JSV65_16625, partial [Armatimonadota bacterium]
MICQRCGAVNPSDRRACGRCGLVFETAQRRRPRRTTASQRRRIWRTVILGLLGGGAGYAYAFLAVPGTQAPAAGAAIVFTAICLVAGLLIGYMPQAAWRLFLRGIFTVHLVLVSRIARSNARRLIAAQRRAIEDDPSDAEAHHRLALLEWVAGQRPAATQHMETAYELTEDDPVVAHNTGIIAAHREDHPRALELLRRAAQALPASPPVQANVAYALIQSEQHDEALAAVEAGLRL